MKDVAAVFATDTSTASENGRLSSYSARFVLVAAIWGCLVAPSGADDRNLLDAWRAKPNVLVILDSGSSMVHDAATSGLVFPAGGDDDGRYASYMERVYGTDALRRSLGPDFRAVLERGAKMHQAKGALLQLTRRGAALNLGFSFFEHEGLPVGHLNFIYRVGEDQPAMMDGSLPGDPLRMGGGEEAGIDGETSALYPIRYGENGDRVFVAQSDPLGHNRGTPGRPRDGDLRLVSFLVDSAGSTAGRPWAKIPMRERKERHLFYHPAFDFDALPHQGWIRGGLLGSRSWKDVARRLGVDVTSELWREDLRRRVVGEIERRPIGTATVSVLERYEVYRSDAGWLKARPADCPVCPAPRITEARYSQHFVANDHDGETSTVGGSGATGMGNDDRSTCRGFVNAEDGVSPVAPMSVPDRTTGETADTRMTVRSFLGPQTSPVFFFPTRPDRRTLPSNRDDYLPLTETVTAIGARPLAESLREALVYFERSVADWDDPLARCRSSFVILITDGGESCEDPQASCAAAFELAPVPVYVIFLGGGADQGAPPSLECIASMTGGRLYGAASSDEIGAALEDVVQDIEQRSRAFASMVAPSVDSERRRPAYLASFIPIRGRSIWGGHLSAYSFDSLAGSSGEGALPAAPPLWDAGDVLAARWDWGDVLTPSPFGTSTDPRSMYYGVDDAGSGRRRLFAYPGDGVRSYDRRWELGTLVFGRWPEAVEDETTEDRARLRNTVDFMRGGAVGSDGAGRSITLRDPDLYGWCAAGTSASGRGCEPGEQPLGLEKLGDIFHSRPQYVAHPSCYACFRADFHGYRGFLAKHRHRRSVLFVGADDGAMHAFDAGLWNPGRGGETRPQYDVGSGRELFAWVPRSVMGVFPALAGTSSHRWTVDGTPTIADVWVDPDTSGGPSADRREWRTMLLWGQRRGGRSYVCLDVTRPDPLDEDGEPLPTGTASGSVPAPSVLRDAGCRDASSNQGCSASWPDFRWEFTDESDEDRNGSPDLGWTWSRPVVAFVRVIREGIPEERMVAFFGGGLSESASTGELGGISGNFIYGLDVETGGILFKAVVDGMAPGDVQLLDLDSDGFVEQLFFGTTAGKVYRVGLEDPGVLDPKTGRVCSWRPEVILSAGPDQPFFMRPTLVPAFVDPEGAAHLAVLIGSGSRDDLLEENPVAHRFYVFLAPDGGPFAEEDLVAVSPHSAAVGVPLLGPGGGAGWYLELASAHHGARWEKVVTPALAFESKVVFSTFSPDGAGQSGDACGSSGTARTYVVSLTNGDPLEGRERCEAHPAPTVFAGDAQLIVEADGAIRVFQVSDDLQLKEPFSPAPVTVGLVDWREE